MDLTALLVFALALFVAAASPGPGIAALVARVLGSGTRGAAAFTMGLAAGDVVWLSVAILGLSALAQTFHGVFLIIEYAGASYLLYLAWRLWTAPVRVGEIEAQELRESGPRLFLAGLAVTMGNPKVMVFYLALLPSLLDIAKVTALFYVELVAVTLGVLGIVFTFYIALAARARTLLRTPRAIRLVNRATGGLMAGAAAAIATR